MDPAQEKAGAESLLKSLINKTLRIHTTDSRMFVGTFKCTDPVRPPPWSCHPTYPDYVQCICILHLLTRRSYNAEQQRHPLAHPRVPAAVQAEARRVGGRRGSRVRDGIGRHDLEIPGPYRHTGRVHCQDGGRGVREPD